MRELLLLVRMRMLQSRHTIRQFLGGSRLRSAVVVVLIIGFWALMFGMFLSGFRFLAVHLQTFSDMIVDYLFAVFFFALFVMMIISNTVISYISLFRSEETSFLFTLPLHAENTYDYRGCGSALFSVWGMLTLVFPMVLAYGLVFRATWHFFAVAVVASLLFTAMTTEIGALTALIVAAFMPRRPRTFTLLFVGLCAATAAVQLHPIWLGSDEILASEGGLRLLLGKFDFTRHWLLPSRWVSHSLSLASARDLSGAGVPLGLLLSNILFLPWLNHRIASRVYGPTWEATQGARGRRSINADGVASKVLRAATAFLPRELHELVLKDAKTFLRDPSQWSQFAVFFGLLALYVVNLPAIGWTEMELRWHSLITLLNLGAASLTLATLTSRFVYPQLSLEGRRIWVTGLLPMRRDLILWGKFIFATVGTFVVTASIMVLSDVILSIPLWMVMVHIIVIACICCGLNGLAIGLGALYPHLESDNPARIVSSFGGTLNLILSIVFITFALAPVASLLHLFVIGETGPHFWRWFTAGMGLMIVLSATACLLPMLVGSRAFSRMEF